MSKRSFDNSAVTLMYHDVVRAETHQESGFPGADAAIYKLDPHQFESHLAAIEKSVDEKPALVTDLLAGEVATARPWMITFDDGGSSFYGCIADKLESIGWRGQFFITTDYIGQPGFLTGEQIIELRRRGHLIGSHSCSHPLRFAACSVKAMEREWNESLRRLSDLIGEKVEVASVPGGHYSRVVAETAAGAGIKALFNSEPRAGATEVDGCLVFGRYAIQRWTSAATAAGMAAGRFMPRIRQRLWWEIRKVPKTLGGAYYLKVREALMEKAQSNH